MEIICQLPIIIMHQSQLIFNHTIAYIEVDWNWIQFTALFKRWALKKNPKNQTYNNEVFTTKLKTIQWLKCYHGKWCGAYWHIRIEYSFCTQIIIPKWKVMVNLGSNILPWKERVPLQEGWEEVFVQLETNFAFCTKLIEFVLLSLETWLLSKVVCCKPICKFYCTRGWGSDRKNFLALAHLRLR